MCSTMHTFFGGENVHSACITQENGVDDPKKSVDTYLAEWGDKDE